MHILLYPKERLFVGIVVGTAPTAHGWGFLLVKKAQAPLFTESIVGTAPTSMAGFFFWCLALLDLVVNKCIQFPELISL